MFWNQNIPDKDLSFYSEWGKKPLEGFECRDSVWPLFNETTGHCENGPDPQDFNALDGTAVCKFSSILPFLSLDMYPVPHIASMCSPRPFI